MGESCQDGHPYCHENSNRGKQENATFGSKIVDITLSIYMGGNLLRQASKLSISKQ